MHNTSCIREQLSHYLIEKALFFPERAFLEIPLVALTIFSSNF
jgi:hypothetical protein